MGQAYENIWSHKHLHTHTHTYIHTYIHTYTHIYTHTYVYTYTHTHIYTYIRIHIHTHTYTHTHIQLKHMAQRHAYSQPIETYSLAPHNRNIWPSPTPTANQYKHMA